MCQLALDHDLRDSLSVGVRDARLKQIAHRVDESQLRQAPGKGLGQFGGNKSKVESLFVRMSLHAAKPFRKSFGVAMLAARTDFRAAADRVPGGISPFDLGVQ